MSNAALPLTTFGSLADPRIVHGVTTRAGGVSVGPYSSLNLGMSVGDDPDAVTENKARLANVLGFEAEQMVTTPQVHGNSVLLVDATTAPTALQTRADILVTTQPGFLIMQRYADCVPILLWHPDGGVVSVAHAGWRGTALNVSGTAAAAVADLGGEAAGIRAGIGPSIGPCCFEVGEEVVAAFPDHPDVASVGPGGRPHLDLWEINRRQLAAAGIPEAQIELSGACTRCQPETYFSHRALGYPAGLARPSGYAQMSDLQARIDRVQSQIADAAARSGRDASAVTLIAVTKTHPAEAVAEAVNCGLVNVGENRVQEAVDKATRVRELLGHDPVWHLIGTLQRNKARAALDLFSMIHSVDSVRLAEALSTRAEGRRIPILLEVYLGEDDARPGFRAEHLDDAVTSISALDGLDLRGLMTVAPLGLDEDGNRRAFRRLRELRDRLRDQHPDVQLPELSMGMTNDYALAIEEGATLVRVGRAIFGERT